jgi:hypothetical protein
LGLGLGLGVGIDGVVGLADDGAIDAACAIIASPFPHQDDYRH